MPALAQSFLAAASEPSQRSFRLALGASLLIHAVVLSIHFKLPEALNRATEHALDVILVNSKSPRKPEHAQAKAQANLDGGGNTDDDRRAKTPLPAAVQVQEGSDLKQAQQRVRQLELQQQQVLTSVAGSKSVANAADRHEPTPPTPTTNSGVDLTSAAIAIARLEAQIARSIEEYNRRPRKKFVGARVEEYRLAQYVEDWRQKVERIGNLNYPEAAKGRLYGNLVLIAVIRADGSLARVDISRSSGKKILDAAARRIVELAAPYPPFPPEVRSEATELEIVRTWSFTKADQLQTLQNAD
jgi:protein TonB